ncbi:MAG: hypothetical protein IPN30_06595 [Flavobacteriales bacterium]|nr:hypothetical protein [Flavobacteriales bacterium]
MRNKAPAELFTASGPKRAVPIFGTNKGMCPETFGAAGDGAHVTHVGHAVQSQDQGCFTTLVGHGYHFVQVLLLHLAQEGDHSLVFGLLGGCW